MKNVIEIPEIFISGNTEKNANIFKYFCVDKNKYSVSTCAPSFEINFCFPSPPSIFEIR